MSTRKGMIDGKKLIYNIKFKIFFKRNNKNNKYTYLL